MSDFRFTVPHVQESQRFQEAFRTISDGLKETLKPDEELALYYVNGPETIRVRHIQLANDTLLVLYGNDAYEQRSIALVGLRAVNLIFKKIKLGEKKERIPIGFSIKTEKGETGDKLPA